MLHLPGRRHRRLSRQPDGPADGETPPDDGPTLRSDELAAIGRWHRAMRQALAVAAPLLVVWILLGFAAEGPWVAAVGAAAAFATIVFGAIVQFGGRCPRCGLRLVPGAWLTIPTRCPRCRVRLIAPTADPPEASDPSEAS